MAIVALLLGGLMLTLSVQVETRNFADTQRKLEEAKDLLLGFSLVNGRLPCPARYASDTDNSQGLESFCSNDFGSGCGSVTTTAPAHGRCSNYYDGYLPAVTLGAQQVDAQKFAVDAWGHRIRYAVSQTYWTSPSYGKFTRRHVTGAATAWSLANTPADLVVCSASPAVTTASACDTGTNVTNTSTVVALVFSIGKNGATGGSGTNEARNLDSNALFVWRVPDPVSAAGGEFDDQMVWIPVGSLYGRMISGGVLP